MEQHDQTLTTAVSQRTSVAGVHSSCERAKTTTDKSEVRLTHRTPMSYAINTQPSPCTVDIENNNVIQTEERLRCLGILRVPGIFGIILYLADVGSDVAAGVSYFQQGHVGWGSLTIGIVLLSAICSAAVIWTWWYDDYKNDPAYRRKRMLLPVLLLDPLVR